MRYLGNHIGLPRSLLPSPLPLALTQRPPLAETSASSATPPVARHLPVLAKPLVGRVAAIKLEREPEVRAP